MAMIPPSTDRQPYKARVGTQTGPSPGWHPCKHAHATAASARSQDAKYCTWRCPTCLWKLHPSSWDPSEALPCLCAHTHVRAAPSARQQKQGVHPCCHPCTLRGLAQSILGVRKNFLDEENRNEPLSKRSAEAQTADNASAHLTSNCLKIGGLSLF